MNRHGKWTTEGKANGMSACSVSGPYACVKGGECHVAFLLRIACAFCRAVGKVAPQSEQPCPFQDRAFCDHRIRRSFRLIQEGQEWKLPCTIIRYDCPAGALETRYSAMYLTMFCPMGAGPHSSADITRWQRFPPGLCQLMKKET